MNTIVMLRLRDQTDSGCGADCRHRPSLPALLITNEQWWLGGCQGIQTTFMQFFLTIIIACSGYGYKSLILSYSC